MIRNESPDLILLLFGDDHTATDILDTLHEIIVDYPTTAVESGFSDMGDVMRRVGVPNTLYLAVKGLTKTTSQSVDSLICK